MSDKRVGDGDDGNSSEGRRATTVALIREHYSAVWQVARNAGLAFGVVGSEHLFYALMKVYPAEMMQVFDLAPHHLASLVHRFKTECLTFKKGEPYSMLVFSPTFEWIFEVAGAISMQDEALAALLADEEVGHRSEADADEDDDEDEDKGNDGRGSDGPGPSGESAASQEAFRLVGMHLIQAILKVGLERQTVTFSVMLSVSKEELERMLEERAGGFPLETLPSHSTAIATYSYTEPPGPPPSQPHFTVDAKKFPIALPSAKAGKELATSLKHAHWVVPGRVLCGSSPEQWDTSGSELKRLIRGYHVDVMVNLQTRYGEYYPNDYRKTVGDVVQPVLEEGHEVSFLHCPIPDFSCPDIRSLVAFVEELLRLVTEGHVLYIHCFGGHGRTGTVVSMLVSAIGNLSHTDAMKALKLLHKHRGCRGCSLLRAELEADEQEETVTAAQQYTKRGHYKATASQSSRH